MFGLNDPLFTTGYQMTPSLAGFYPNDPTFIALGTEWPGFYSGCLLNDPIFWRVHILPDRPLLLTWSRHIPVTSDRECPPGGALANIYCHLKTKKQNKTKQNKTKQKQKHKQESNYKAAIVGT